MKKAIGLAAATAALSLMPVSTASAAPTHPDRWVLHEAHKFGCIVEHREKLPFGPPNQGVSCHVGTQRYDVLYYRRIEHAVTWWKNWVRGSRCWIARDGLVLIIPQGSTQSGVDSGAYRRDAAMYAARHLGGYRLRA